MFKKNFEFSIHLIEGFFKTLYNICQKRAARVNDEINDIHTLPNFFPPQKQSNHFGSDRASEKIKRVIE